MSKLLHSRTNSRTARYGVVILIVSTIGLASLVALRPAILLDLVASTVASLTGATTTVFFMPYGDETLVPGATTSIDINIDTKVPINALGATISFPKDSLEIVGISKEKSFFNLWTEDTSIDEDTGEIHFSGGTTRQGGITGTGTVLTLTVRAKIPGSAQLQFEDVQVYPNNDTGTSLDTQTHAITYTIEEPALSATPTNGFYGRSASSATLAPNPDLNEDGRINLVDLSILIFKILGVYDPRFDLNQNGSVGLDDLSILLSKF